MCTAGTTSKRQQALKQGSAPPTESKVERAPSAQRRRLHGKCQASRPARLDCPRDAHTPPRRNRSRPLQWSVWRKDDDCNTGVLTARGGSCLVALRLWSLRLAAYRAHGELDAPGHGEKANPPSKARQELLHVGSLVNGRRVAPRFEASPGVCACHRADVHLPACARLSGSARPTVVDDLRRSPLPQPGR